MFFRNCTMKTKQDWLFQLRHLFLKTASLLSECSECSEYRTKCDNLYHLCQMQEKELEHLRALIDAHNIDY
ncbi:hypothetical protein BFD65_22575 [Escherichia coli]|nr:hypothetical protein AWG36_12890 [Escherichia coli]ROL15541.1 hypothetical protein BFD65_22575 [Escherichia coli]